MFTHYVAKHVRVYMHLTCHEYWNGSRAKRMQSIGFHVNWKYSLTKVTAIIEDAIERTLQCVNKLNATVPAACYDITLIINVIRGQQASAENSARVFLRGSLYASIAYGNIARGNLIERSYARYCSRMKQDHYAYHRLPLLITKKTAAISSSRE